MPIFKKNAGRPRLVILKDIPTALEIRQGAPGAARFRGGEAEPIGCLGCSEPRCMYFSERDVACDRLADFSHDQARKTCPVDAITWDGPSAVPAVDPQKCIRCGICVHRCPVGALYFSSRGRVTVNTVPGTHTETVQPDAAAQKTHARQLAQLLRVPRSGVSLQASDTLFSAIYKKLQQLDHPYHPIVARNLLIALGCQCAVRRVGDVNTRMDGVYSSPAGSFGAVEVEFGKGRADEMLDVPRNILDDIAVLNARYGVPKHEDKALVVCLQLPNARQEYWQVLRDIRLVEEIRVGTVTVGALMFLLWNGAVFAPEGDRYYLDFDDMDLRRVLCAQTGQESIPLSSKKLGILEPMK